eukprot:TRINITY_DN16489_c0_g1_i3.p1 TRINITY_DN16489_c0_g1~~TRINITY_DN16489_c0_g1_i3.p1  ORF type:complete len:1009 (+),score=200.06 TRINITY_DN16489_c0_g1_i3:86-3112(+)
MGSRASMAKAPAQTAETPSDASSQNAQNPSDAGPGFLQRRLAGGVAAWDQSKSKTSIGLTKDVIKGAFLGPSSLPTSTDAVDKQQDLALEVISESDRLIAISAALSKFVYTEGERMVKLEERNGLGASAFYYAQDDIAKKDGIAGWIADDTALEIHDEDKQPGIKEGGFDNCWVRVRYDGSPAWVKMHNIIAPRLRMQVYIGECTPGIEFKEKLEFRRSIAETLADLMQAAVKEDMKEDKKFSATDVEVFIETFTPDQDGEGTSSGTVEVRIKLGKLTGMTAGDVADMFIRRCAHRLESKIAEKLSLKEVDNVHLIGRVGVMHMDNLEASKSNSGIFRRNFKEETELKQSLETLLMSGQKGFQRILDEHDKILYCEFKPGGAMSPSSMSILLQLEKEKQKVYFVAWQGTQVDERPMDIMTDLAAAPARCAAWNDLYPHVLAHSAIMAKVQSDFLEKFPPGAVGKVLQARMPKGEDYEHVVMFTGHSLGGGCARIAHLIAQAELERVAPNCDHIKLRSYTFAAPMVFYVEKENGDKVDVQYVREVFAKTSVNCVCEDDVVPRLPAYPRFAMTAIQGMVKGVLLGTAKRNGLDIREGGNLWMQADQFLGSMMSDFVKNSALRDLGGALHNFEHMALIKWFRPVSDCSDRIVKCFVDKNDSAFGTPGGKAWEQIPPDQFASLMLAYHSWIHSSVRYVPRAPAAADAGTREKDDYQGFPETQSVIYFEISESQKSKGAGDSPGLPFGMPSFKLAHTEALHECLQDEVNAWSIDLGKLKNLNAELAKSLNDVKGHIIFDATPPEKITLPQVARQQLGIPDSAIFFSWCYPAPAVSGLNLGESEDANFLMLGGYMYFEKHTPIALLAVSVSSDGQLTFGERQVGTKQDFNDMLQRSNRFQAVTMPQLRKCGLDRFAWLHCNEKVGERTIRHGGFAYIFQAAASSPAAGTCAATEQRPAAAPAAQSCSAPKPEHWVCLICEEPNKLVRKKCNNCGWVKPLPDNETSKPAAERPLV